MTRRVIAGQVIPTDAVRALGRFDGGAATRYRAVPPWGPASAPERDSREEAFADIEAHLMGAAGGRES